MDSFVNDKDFVLLSRDHYTFEVLTRILKGDCEIIRSNHENLLLCHSESNYPVWIWTPDNAPEEVKENAWALVCNLCPLGKGYRHNLKYELAEYFIQKAAEEGVGAGGSKNLYAYDCPRPIPMARYTVVLRMTSKKQRPLFPISIRRLEKKNHPANIAWKR